MALPTTVWYILFCFLPMFGLVIAFKNYKITGGKSFIYNLFHSDWAGFKNFSFLIRSNDLFVILRNTILYNLAFIVLGMIFSVGLAIMISLLHNKRASKVYQTMMFFPYFMSKNGANFLLNLNYDDLSSGLPAIGVKYGDDSKTVVNPLDDEEILSNLDIVRKMYQEGIINGDAPTADDSSKYAMFFAAQGWSGAAKTTWGPNNGIANCSAVQYGNTVVSNTTVRGSINGIYSGCKHPDKALQLLNLVNTDSKVRDWFYYGAEGKDFEYTDDNKVHRLTTDWGMAGYTQGTFFNVTQTDDVDFNQWDEVEELNEKATPSEMLGFNLDTSNIETELANCRAVYEKYYSELFTGAQDPRELVKTIDAELETAGWETIREEAQKQIDAQK